MIEIMEQLSPGLFHWAEGKGAAKDSFIIMQLEDIVPVAWRNSG